MLMPTGLLLPYRASRVIPATIVGRAKGRSMRALTTRLPGNSSRTSTQATTVPIPAFPAATASATTKVRRRVTVPRSSAAPPRTSSPIRRPARVLAANRHPDCALDAGYDPGLLVEEPLVHVGPTAQVLDGEQARRLREVGPGGGRGTDRPVAALGVHLLGRLGPQEVHEGAGRGRVLGLGR